MQHSCGLGAVLLFVAVTHFIKRYQGMCSSPADLVCLDLYEAAEAAGSLSKVVFFVFAKLLPHGRLLGPFAAYTYKLCRELQPFESQAFRPGTRDPSGYGKDPASAFQRILAGLPHRGAGCTY